MITLPEKATSTQTLRDLPHQTLDVVLQALIHPTHGPCRPAIVQSPDDLVGEQAKLDLAYKAGRASVADEFRAAMIAHEREAKRS